MATPQPDPPPTDDVEFAYARDIHERLAIHITRVSGSMTMFYALVAWYVIWCAVNSLRAVAWDPYPFPFLLFLSNALQLWWLPVLSVGQLVVARAVQAQMDRLETVVGAMAQVLRNQTDEHDAMVELLRRDVRLAEVAAEKLGGDDDA